MLSKSSARLFFISGTLIFSVTFLLLTIDTVAKVPDRSNQDEMTPAVVRGHDIWTDNNCMGCHTLLGEGAYYAPELTKVVERRGEVWIHLFLKDPQGMFPGRRKMVKYDFTHEQRSDLIAFFAWVGKIDTNGFPPQPDMALQAAPATSSTMSTAFSSKHNPPQMFSSVCTACHAIDGQGGNVGPALDGVGSRFNTDQLRSWLKDPQEYKPGTTMPNLNLEENTIEELVVFLSNL